MNRVFGSEEKHIYQLLDRFTSQNDFWASEKPIPEKIGFQRIGVQLREEDLEQDGVSVLGYYVRDRNETRIANSGFSVVKNSKTKFEVELDVWPFKRDQLVVFFIPGRYLTIKGEYEEEGEDQSECSRMFQRYYCFPKGSDSSTLTSVYCRGILKCSVEKRAVEESPEEGRVVDITMGTPKKIDGKWSPNYLKYMEESSISVVEVLESGDEDIEPVDEDIEPADRVKSNASDAAEETEPSEEISVREDVREV